MSLGRLFLINELRRLEMRFHPDNSGDEEAVEYIRAAIQALAPQSARNPEPDLPSYFTPKAS
jgi:hypothetical protein